MGKRDVYDIPLQCPITGEDLLVTELTSADTGVTIRGRFKVPRLARLEPEQAHFLETFLRARGVITTVEKELGISYPTVRSRLDALLDALQLTPVKDDRRKEKEKQTEAKRKILDDLEAGRITAQEAKSRLRVEEKL